MNIGGIWIFLVIDFTAAADVADDDDDDDVDVDDWWQQHILDNEIFHLEKNTF